MLTFYSYTGSPHTVKNLTHTLAISGNYIDDSNFEAAKEEVSLMSHCNPEAKVLLQHLLVCMVTLFFLVLDICIFPSLKIFILRG